MCRVAMLKEIVYILNAVLEWVDGSFSECLVSFLNHTLDMALWTTTSLQPCCTHHLGLYVINHQICLVSGAHPDFDPGSVSQSMARMIPGTYVLSRAQLLQEKSWYPT